MLPSQLAQAIIIGLLAWALILWGLLAAYQFYGNRSAEQTRDQPLAHAPAQTCEQPQQIDGHS